MELSETHISLQNTKHKDQHNRGALVGLTATVNRLSLEVTEIALRIPVRENRAVSSNTR